MSKKPFQVSKVDYIMDNPQCRRLIDEARNYHMMPARMMDFSSPRVKHRTDHDYEEVLTVSRTTFLYCEIVYIHGHQTLWFEDILYVHGCLKSGMFFFRLSFKLPFKIVLGS